MSLMFSFQEENNLLEQGEDWFMGQDKETSPFTLRSWEEVLG